MGEVMRSAIIDGDIDDDCQSDEEQVEDAQKMLKDELIKAIAQYKEEKKEAKSSIKNRDLAKRYSKI